MNDLAAAVRHTSELDAELVRRCRADDSAAFGALVERYKERIYRFVSRMVGPTDAEDLAQEVFVKAYTGLAGYRGSASLTTWLYRIAANLCIDYRRRRKHAPARAVSWSALFGAENEEGIAEPADPVAGPEDLALRSELQAHVQAAIGSLPDRLRMVVLLFDMEGLSYDEISRVLGCPMGTVKSRLFSARTALRRALAPYMADLATAARSSEAPK